MLGILYSFVIEPLILIFELTFSLSYKLIQNPGIAIICLSVVVNLLCLPLYRMADAQQEAERAKQKSMERWVNHIKKHFKGDEQYMMLTTYYREQHYSQLSQLRGSISLVLQIPIFIAAYRFLSDLSLLHNASFLFISDLGSPDQLLTIGGIAINILPIAMTLLNVASSAVYTRDLALRDKAQTYILALLFLVLLYNSPSGLVMYWTCNQIFSLIKNLLTKVIPHGREVAVAFAELALVGGFVLLLALGKLHETKKLVFVLAVILVAQVPLLYPYVENKLGRAKRRATIRYEQTIPTFVLGALLIAMVLGMMVPSALIGDSPAEFVDLANFVNPLTFITHGVVVYLGLFLLWVGIFFFLSDNRGRNSIALALWCLAGVFLVNYLFFGRNLGVIDKDLIFDKSPSYGLQEKLLNTGAIVLVVLALMVVWKKQHRIVVPALSVMLVAVVGVSIPNIASIVGTTNEMIETQRTQEEQSKEKGESNSLLDENGNPKPITTLSKNGKNVIVLFMDRAIGALYPYMFQERPELVQQLDGFTFYPNTISYGGHTVFGAPALYGGYEYTPTEMNKRDNERLVDKHNEAIKVLPKIFLQEGYNVTLTDPAYLDYKNNTYDYSSLSDLEGLNVCHTIGAYAKPYKERYLPNNLEDQKRNFLLYSIFKCSPIATQKIIYNKGDYLVVSKEKRPREDFLDSYSVIDSLPQLTNVSDDDSNNVLLLHSLMTHCPNELQLPDYTPNSVINNKGLETKIREAVGYDPLILDTSRKLSHYHTDIAFAVELGKFCDYLREQGVYDNTRIIVVSDHGHRNVGCIEDLVFDESNLNFDGMRYNPLLMVKDFNSTGFTTSNEFMANADTPTLALKDLVDDPVNPYTGKQINNDEKTAHPQRITTSRLWKTTESQSGNVFDTHDSPWVTVHDNIYDKNNWEIQDYFEPMVAYAQ